MISEITLVGREILQVQQCVVVTAPGGLIDGCQSAELAAAVKIGTAQVDVVVGNGALQKREVTLVPALDSRGVVHHSEVVEECGACGKAQRVPIILHGGGGDNVLVIQQLAGGDGEIEDKVVRPRLIAGV